MNLTATIPISTSGASSASRNKHSELAPQWRIEFGEHLVRRIRGHRGLCMHSHGPDERVRLYLVRWQDCPKSKDSWVRASTSE